MSKTKRSIWSIILYTLCVATILGTVIVTYVHLNPPYHEFLSGYNYCSTDSMPYLFESAIGYIPRHKLENLPNNQKRMTFFLRDGYSMQITFDQYNKNLWSYGFDDIDKFTNQISQYSYPWYEIGESKHYLYPNERYAPLNVLEEYFKRYVISRTGNTFYDYNLIISSSGGICSMQLSGYRQMLENNKDLLIYDEKTEDIWINIDVFSQFIYDIMYRTYEYNTINLKTVESI